VYSAQPAWAATAEDIILAIIRGRLATREGTQLQMFPQYCNTYPSIVGICWHSYMLVYDYCRVTIGIWHTKADWLFHSFGGIVEFHLVLTLVNATAIFWQLTVKSCHSKCEINNSNWQTHKCFFGLTNMISQIMFRIWVAASTLQTTQSK